MSEPYYADDLVTLLLGDSLDLLTTMSDGSVDAVLTDPPYGLEFMGKDWDRPWAVGMSATGYTDGGKRLTRPSHGDNRNPTCRTCGARARGAKRCECEAPDWKPTGVGRGVNVAAERSAELTPRGRGHETSGGAYLAAGVDSVRIAGKPFQDWCEVWARECLRVLKPGGYMLAFGGSRTWHRLASAVEDAGFEIRDSIAWLYGSGFPKSLDVSKAIDKQAGHWRGRAGEPESPNESMSGANYARTDKGDPVTPAAAAAAGWGTALKPAFEPIVVGRKPLAGTVAQNWITHGTGALNIAACRTGETVETWPTTRAYSRHDTGNPIKEAAQTTGAVPAGRWPTNVVLDDSQAAELDRQSGVSESRIGKPRGAASGDGWGMTATGAEYADVGGASRFFPTFRYEAKAPQSERPRGDDGSAHPTVKPLDLMRWLVRLVTPAGGLVLDPFLGSGTTAEACVVEGFRCIGIEREETYMRLAVARLSKPIETVLDFGAVS